jgi:uncharacterized membrane protein YjgN (DUF898 family)
MILGVIAEVMAEFFLNAQLRRHRVLRCLFWIVLSTILVVAIILGLMYPSDRFASHAGYESPRVL